MAFLEDKFKRIFIKLENGRVPIWYYIASFLFIVLLRDFLEFFLYKFENIDLQLVVHFSLYYIALALFAIIFFQKISSEKIPRIARVVLPAFIILLTPIIVDSILSLFRSPIAAPAYIYPNGFGDIILRFFTFFGPTESGAGITPGMKVEIALLLFLIFQYLRYKKLNIKKSALGLLLFYSTIFLSFITPSILASVEWVSYFWTFVVFGSHAAIEPNYSEFTFINFFLIISFALSVVLFRILDRKMFEKIYLEFKFRFTRILHFCAMAVLGIAFASKNFGPLENLGLPLIDYILTFICLMLAIASFFIFSCMINNVVDSASDLLSSERPITYNKKNDKQFLLVMLVIFLFGSLFALGVNYKAFLILICFTGAYFIYSVPPFRFKAAGFISKLIIGFNSLLIVILGYSLVPRDINLDIHSLNSISSILPIKYIIFVLCFSFPINYIDLKDIEGDRSDNIKTLPVLLGAKRAKMLIGIMFAVMYLSTFFILKSPLLLFLATVAAIVQYYVINFRKYSDQLVSYCYLATIAIFIAAVFMLGK